MKMNFYQLQKFFIISFFFYKLLQIYAKTECDWFDNGKKNHLYTCMYTRICMRSGRIFVKEIHEDVLFNSRASIVLISKSFQKYVNP